MDQKFVSRMTERGQTSVPSEIRNALHIVAGQRLLWRFNPKTGEIRVQAPPKTAEGAAAALGFCGRFRRLRKTEDWIRDYHTVGGAS